jgi:hypothetical protein
MSVIEHMPHRERVNGGLLGTRVLSYIYKPDKPDNLGRRDCIAMAYDCRVPVANPTSPDIPTPKPDKTTTADWPGGRNDYQNE